MYGGIFREMLMINGRSKGASFNWSTWLFAVCSCTLLLWECGKREKKSARTRKIEEIDGARAGEPVNCKERVVQFA